MNKIEFFAAQEYIDEKSFPPEPMSLNIPKWYKELKHNFDYRTVKGCMPFLDTLITGYLLKTPIDYQISHNIIKENKRHMGALSPVGMFDGIIGHMVNVNKEFNLERHDQEQLGKCPYVHTNKDLPIHKILNPWKIKTPPGYSCLFLPPMNNPDDRFSIIPGIVDTDTFPNEINFPIIINGDKYPVLETLIKLGTPYVQVIPFKREKWKMELKPRKDKDALKERFFATFKILDVYKSKWWSKKSWK
tara:strand:+ start:1787 stop:2524 length:738 start_codon:yes stop_codon:yes gene_type:complete